MNEINKVPFPTHLLYVSDQISKDMYFPDCEIVGWVFIEEKERIQLYYAYRNYNLEQQREYLTYDPDERISTIKERDKMLTEIHFQLQESGDPKELKRIEELLYKVVY